MRSSSAFLAAKKSSPNGSSRLTSNDSLQTGQISLIRSSSFGHSCFDMQTVSHRSVSCASPVDFKLHHYRNAQIIKPNGLDQARLLSLENAWNQGVQQKDITAIDALLDKDLIYIDYDGTVMNKAQYMARARGTTVDSEHVVNDSMQAQVYGKSAVVVGVCHESGLKNGKPYLLRERFVDTWINRNGAWMCVASQSTLIVH